MGYVNGVKGQGTGTEGAVKKRQLEILVEGPMPKEMEGWTSCWAWESQCSRNHGAKELALLVTLQLE